MKRVTDSEGHGHVELTAQEARQARYGRPVLYVLIGGIVGTLVGYGIAGLLLT